MKILRIFKNGQKEKGIGYTLLNGSIGIPNMKSLSSTTIRRIRLFSQNNRVSLAAARMSLKSHIISELGSRKLCYFISKKLNLKAI